MRHICIGTEREVLKKTTMPMVRWLLIQRLVKIDPNIHVSNAELCPELVWIGYCPCFQISFDKTSLLQGEVGFWIDCKNQKHELYKSLYTVLYYFLNNEGLHAIDICHTMHTLTICLIENPVQHMF